MRNGQVRVRALTACRVVGALVVVGTVASGCANLIAGTATWPGAKLQKVVLTAADFPPGVQYNSIVDDPGRPDGAGGPPIMSSEPDGCANGLTDVIARSAERGPGAAAKYRVQYDGVTILMTVLTSPLDLTGLQDTATRCEHFDVFFDPTSDRFPITTTKVPTAESGALVYQQTMRLGNSERSVYASFENINGLAVFGAALPADNPSIPVKASLPQTFLDVAVRQADRMKSA
jgi:hypothetical protein